MSVLSYRTGPTQLVRVPSDPAFTIRPGMLVGLFGSAIRPPSGTPWAGDVDATRSVFAEVFLGVAHSAAEAGVSQMVSVDLSPLAVYAPALEAGGCAFGAGLAPADAGGELSDDLLAPTGSRASAVGLALETAAADAPVVRAAFASVYSPAANTTKALGPS
ncbi:hypothetical protein [Alienimonas californiensis]|uniref:Uncharacterized protein n=1 Tax=Alienimonas californiensis TaxID=2527989 RepID=A0A517P6Y2_9PLAN|nr:hypothetical protein [Alienimonas californiensis]QDT15131.1 hypothetical protein CA12_12120 [Alienimonas californiensis]